VYESGPEKKFGSMNFKWNLESITVPSDSDATMSKVARFLLFNTTSRKNAVPETDKNVTFDQFVECIGEDDAVEMFELWGDGRFGETQTLYTDSTFPSVDMDQNSNEMIPIPYGFGFVKTGHDLRFHGAGATAVSDGEKPDKFMTDSQSFMDNGLVSTQHVYGNMLFMASRLQAYSSGFQKEEIAKVNVAMDLQEVILKFLNQAQVNPVSSQHFLRYLRSIHNSSRKEIDEIWPNHPSGISQDQLQNYLDENPDLSAKVMIQEGVILTKRWQQIWDLCAGQSNVLFAFFVLTNYTARFLPLLDFASPTHSGLSCLQYSSSCGRNIVEIEGEQKMSLVIIKYISKFTTYI
jgi:hypothetical protein